VSHQLWLALGAHEDPPTVAPLQLDQLEQDLRVIALEIGARPEWEGKTIVTILPSYAERYLSSQLFDVTFMAA